MELRTVLDWFIKPQLRTVPGVIEVNSFGGEEKQYQVLVDPNKLVSHGLSLAQVIEALEKNNSNAGGAYIEHAGEQQLLRGVGLIQNERDIENIVVASHQGTPIFIRNIGEVGLGAQVRQGAATRDGKGETVMGMAMMLKGENSRAVAERVERKLQETAKALPPGVVVSPFYNRSDLVDRTVRTAVKNLVEGGLIVMAVLFLFLLQLRAGLIVSSAIPLSMLAAIIAMKYFGVSANLMSLGAIDFGLIVDAAVIIIENCVRQLAERRRQLGRALDRGERIETIRSATLEVRRASQFGEIIIIAAYLPILALVGIEGKMFRPMALTVVFALSGALILSMTVIPALAALFLREPRKAPKTARRDEEENPVVRRLMRLLRPRSERCDAPPGPRLRGRGRVPCGQLPDVLPAGQRVHPRPQRGRDRSQHGPASERVPFPVGEDAHRHGTDHKGTAGGRDGHQPHRPPRDRDRSHGSGALGHVCLPEAKGGVENGAHAGGDR